MAQEYYFQKSATGLPSKLEPGEHVDVVVPWDGKLASPMGYPKSAKATVSTSIGSERVKVGRSLRKYFREQYRSNRNESPSSE